MTRPDVVSLHDTWFSVDPVLGCPASCAYCYLGPMDLRSRKPRASVEPNEVWRLLRTTPGYLETRIPVAIGNYTDMLMTRSNRAYVRRFAELWAAESDGRPLCIVTKSRLTAQIMTELVSTGVKNVIFFLSQSFSQVDYPDIERGPVSSFDQTLENARIIRGESDFDAVHFWRPFISVFNPLHQIDARVRLLDRAGVTSSVVVGHKRFNANDGVDRAMAGLVASDNDSTSDSGDEDFYESGFARLVASARAIDYPVYRNTSCAISHTQSIPDMLGTHLSPVAEQRCVSVSCRSTQRAVCASDNQRRPPPQSLRRLAMLASVPLDQLQLVDEGLDVSGEISESAYSLLSHLTASHVRAAEVTPQKAWMGSASGYEDLTAFREISDESPAQWFSGSDDVLRLTERLRRITGFATCYSTQDARFEVFNRREHVQRVAWIARSICGDDAALLAQTQRYVWLHDLNRWAFAHNSEKGLYSQPDHVASFFRTMLDVSEVEVTELEAFHRKDVGGKSLAIQCALIADMLAGLTEDPLMLMAGLNVSASIFDGYSSPVLDAYRTPEAVQAISRAAHALHIERNTKAFRQTFATLYASSVRATWGRLSTGRSLSDALAAGRSEAREFKSSVLAPRVFPINNDVVSRSPEIKSIVERLIGDLGFERANELMLRATDETFAELAKTGEAPDALRRRVEPSLGSIASQMGVSPVVEV